MKNITGTITFILSRSCSLIETVTKSCSFRKIKTIQTTGIMRTQILVSDIDAYLDQ